MNRIKPNDEKRNVRVTLSLSTIEKDLIKSLQEFYGWTKVQVVTNGLRQLEKKYIDDKKKQTKISLTDEKEFL